MAWTKMEICAILGVIVCIFAAASAAGSKGLGDECILGIVAGIGVGNEADTCNEDANLACLSGKCMCNPAGYVHQSGFLGIEFLGGGCKLRAGAPCTEGGTSCVSHSTCKINCQCDEGYHNNLLNGDCSSGAVMTMAANFLLLATGLLCYFHY